MCMMVTILLREQGAMIALCSHSDPPLIYSDLRRPGSSHSGIPLIYSAWTTRWTDTPKHRLRDRGRDTIIQHGRLYDIKGHIITRGMAVLCIIGLWSFYRKKIADHVGPICSIVIMARLRTLIRDDMITVR